ncbi:MAG: molybdate ABC transporter substrate-binding protein [Pseudomonadota bacterium]
MTGGLLRIFLALLLFLAACSPFRGPPADVRVAVATNFKPALEQLLPEFERETGYRVQLTAGSTGKLYAQIRQGAPFDVFLAADQVRPMALEEAGLIFGNSRFTYAVGQLVLWSPEDDVVGPADLDDPDLKRVALAQPDLAPYGQAAAQVFEHLELEAVLETKGVFGENIGQTFAFVQTGNAELGFVAHTQVLSLPDQQRGGVWHPPAGSYAPIRQDAVMLGRAADRHASGDFMVWLARDTTQARIAALGYAQP